MFEKFIGKAEVEGWMTLEGVAEIDRSLMSRGVYWVENCE